VGLTSTMEMVLSTGMSRLVKGEQADTVVRPYAIETRHWSCAHPYDFFERIEGRFDRG